ncbi:teichoic acid D-Ala incorporation-associated protein DltX [Oscillospiraceae bacterium OttesenSCG-928-G22]|nr:teichoic acid D-Ala incorporation-associated protein DltX [Oscillospiraceae bacterium OttesenSCG-928-G22]
MWKALKETVYRSPALRFLFYFLVFALLIYLYLSASGEQIHFVYNDF